MQSADWRMDWKLEKLVTIRLYGGGFYLPAWIKSAIALNRYRSSNLSKNEGIKLFSTEASF